MNKYFTLLSMAIVLTQCQRPPYAGSSNRIPAVLPQYLPQEQSQSTVAAAGSPIDNRINADDMTSSNSPLPYNLPADALGDIDLINRIKTWPREQQPFWYLNQQQIEQHRGGSTVRANRPTRMSSQRPFFTNY